MKVFNFQLKYWKRKESILKLESLESSASEDIVMHFENENL